MLQKKVQERHSLTGYATRNTSEKENCAIKKCILFTAVCGITFGITAIAMSQTYFEDNFDDPKASADKWVPLSGEWEFKNVAD